MKAGGQSSLEYDSMPIFLSLAIDIVVFIFMIYLCPPGLFQKMMTIAKCECSRCCENKKGILGINK